MLAAIGKGLKIQSHILIIIASAPVKLSSIVDRTFTLEQIAEAHRYMESNQQTGKIMVTVTIGHGVVVDRWIRKEARWYLQHRVYQQMSVNAAFLPDNAMREKAAKTPKN